MRTVIYCDAPYANTSGYKTDFDFQEYYDWLDLKVQEGHIVLVSEYTMPDGWVVIYEKQLNASVGGGKSKVKDSEKLFIHSTQLDIYKESFPDV